MKKRTLLLVAALAARAAAAQTSRTVAPVQYWPALQAELALKNGDYLLLALGGRRDTGNDIYDNPDRVLGLDDRRVAVGYEHFWNDRWSWGGVVRYHTADIGHGDLVPEVLLRHRNQLGPLTFGQRLDLEYTYLAQRLVAYEGMGLGEEVWTRLRVDLEKLLPMGQLALRPRLSYEAATHLRLQKAATDNAERTIQYTSLRGEVGVKFNPHFDLTPWFAYRTTYYVRLPWYNSMGVQVSGTRLNVVAPTVGLDLRYTIFQGKTAFERQQLPTQH